MNLFTYTTQSEIRDAFWESHPHFTRRKGWKQNQYLVDIRVSFVDFVECLRRDEQISEKLAMRVTL